MTVTFRAHMAPALLVVACSVFATRWDATALSQSVPFSQRDGAAEANADIKAKRPTQLYSAVFNGRVPGFITPGITDCNPRYTGGRAGTILFVDLPEAGWQEPAPLSWPQRDVAIEFARRYNQTMFKSRKADIQKSCPRAGLGS